MDAFIQLFNDNAGLFTICNTILILTHMWDIKFRFKRLNQKSDRSQ